MPTGIYIRTKEVSQETRLKIRKSILGQKRNELTKQKIREKLKGNKNHLGKHHTLEAKQKIGLAHKYIFMKEKNPFYGKKHTPQSIQKMKENRINKTWEELMGIEKAKERKERLISRVKGNKYGLGNKYNLGRTFSDEHKRKLKEKRAKQKTHKKDTKIEVKIQNYLIVLGIEFYTHQYMNIEHGYQCDIFIPSLNMVIECDGDYWHKYPTKREIDNIRTKELIEKGFKVLRLWEHEIKVISLEQFQETIKKY